MKIPLPPLPPCPCGARPADRLFHAWTRYCAVGKLHLARFVVVLFVFFWQVTPEALKRCFYTGDRAWQVWQI